MASRRTGLDDERIQSFGGCIDRGRKTGRSSPDDDDIAQVILVDALVEAETVGNLLIARPFQHGHAAADQDGYVGPLYLKAIEQVLHVGVTVEIEVLERMAVAREEFLDT